MSEVEAAAAPAVSEGNASASIPTPVQVVETPKPTMEDTMAAAWDKLNPPRDENQRFVAKDKPETAVEETPAEPIEGQTPSEEKVEPAAPAITYPSSLPAELREKLAAAAPELAEWVNKREAESHKRITELGQAAKASEQFRQVAERYKPSFHGRDPVQAFEQLAAASEYLERDAQGAIKWLANSYGIDLSKLGEGQPASTETSPEVAQLRQTISRLEQRLNETSSKVSSREEAEKTQKQQSVEKLIEDFAKDKPYWGELEAEVAAQIHAIQATEANLAPDKVLTRAYDRALKLSEGIQAKIQADTKAEAEKKAKAEAARKAAEAKKAGSVNVKSGQGASPKANGNWESTLREAADRLMG
jgi:hypothetical protein